MKKSIISIGLRVLGTLLFLAATLRAEDKNAFKGGVGIGPVRLKADVAEVEKLFGQPSDKADLGRGARVWFVQSSAGEEEEIVVLIRRAENGHDYYVSEVAVTSPGFRTPAGNSTRSDLAAIWREFPDLSKVESGQAMDGTTMELYSSRESGVGVLIEPPAGTPASDKRPAGVPPGKCRALLVHLVGENASFVQLGVAPKKADSD